MVVDALHNCELLRIPAMASSLTWSILPDPVPKKEVDSRNIPLDPGLFNEYARRPWRRMKNQKHASNMMTSGRQNFLLRHRSRMNARARKISKAICAFGRHRLRELDWHSERGDMRVTELRRRFTFRVDESEILDVAKSAGRTKIRFKLTHSQERGWMIRCIAGHSVQVKVDENGDQMSTDNAHPEFIGHYTTEGAIDNICQFGLRTGQLLQTPEKRRGRTHIHLRPLPDYPFLDDCLSDTFVIVFRVQKLLASSIVLIQTLNKDILTKGDRGILWPKYFHDIIDNKGRSCLPPE